MSNLAIPDGAESLLSSSVPQLTINHDVAAGLDSTNAFEGPEKLLEVWFAPGPTSLPPGTSPGGLKAVPSETWVGMLDMVNCKILSVLESESMDAYLLSESSMFVFPHKLILKTCGTTTLLLGLQRMLHIAAVNAGFPFHNAASVDDIRAAATPYRLFYSRKNFLFPDAQRGPHRSWKQEVQFLDDMFEGGSAYMVGKMNGDHWYLYITSPSQALTPPQTPQPGGTCTRIPVGGPSIAEGSKVHSDETLEILMTDLDVDNAKQFFLADASAAASNKLAKEAEKARKDAADNLGALSSEIEEVDVFDNEPLEETNGVATSDATEALTTEGHALGTVVAESCGLSDVYSKEHFPDARVDAYLFSPCGFSANGVVPSPSAAEEDKHSAAHYWTVHVTPEPGFSFASFETNVPGGQSGRTTAEIIEHVVGIFQPGRFSVTLFEAKPPETDDGGAARGLANKKLADPVKGYRRVDRIVHDFEEWDLVFRFYEREGWQGGRAARVGEVDGQ